MQSFRNLVNKKRRFSQEELSSQNIQSHFVPLHQKYSLKFQKLSSRNNQCRKSMQLEKISKLQQNFDLRKRQTQWKRINIDSIQFHKILQKRKNKNKFHFKSMDIHSTQHRSLNSFVQSNNVQTMQNSALQFQIKHQKGLSLIKQSEQISNCQKQLKRLQQQQVEEKTKNKVLAELIEVMKQGLLQSQKNSLEKDKNISDKQKYFRAVRKQQERMDFFIRSTNQIQDKIINYKTGVVSLRNQRVVYSSIFKELQKQVKFAQNSYNKILLGSAQYLQKLYLHTFYEQNSSYGQDFQRSQVSMNSYMEYKQFFSTILKSESVKFNGTNGIFDEEFLHDRINSNSAINYYTQSRKIIVLPRYKEHYQSSRKKIKLEKQQKSFQELFHQILRILSALQLVDKFDKNQYNQYLQKYVEKVQKSDQIGLNRYQKSFYKLKKQQNKGSLPSIHSNLEKANNKENQNFSIETFIQKLKAKKISILTQNDEFFQGIQNLENEIQILNQKIAIQKTKLKNFKAAFPSTKNIQLFSASQKQKFEFLIQNKEQQTLKQQQCQHVQEILSLFGLKIQNNINYTIFSKVQNLQNMYLATKTQNITKQSKSKEEKSEKNSTNDQINTDRSNISIKFKKINQNIVNQSKNDQTDIVFRGPKTLNSMLKNILIYDSYQRAFQRIDFEKEYEIQKNRKKRTLIRREGMVSMGILKKQNQEKAKFVKRKSSNKKQN